MYIANDSRALSQDGFTTLPAGLPRFGHGRRESRVGILGRGRAGKILPMGASQALLGMAIATRVRSHRELRESGREKLLAIVSDREHGFLAAGGMAFAALTQTELDGDLNAELEEYHRACACRL